MRTRTKVLITILLAVLWFWLTGCSGPKRAATPTPTREGEADLQYMEAAFNSYNDQYFHNRLNKPDFYLTGDHVMAETICDNSGANCKMGFNIEYVKAQRIADYVVLHEMCHVSTWTKDPNHGRGWRSCMLSLDSEGAFREIFIDEYVEK